MPLIPSSAKFVAAICPTVNHLISLQSNWFLTESSVTTFISIHVLKIFAAPTKNFVTKNSQKTTISKCYPKTSSISKGLLLFYFPKPLLSPTGKNLFGATPSPPWHFWVTTIKS
jgi:hypothetical protein